MSDPIILLIDDEQTIRSSLRTRLEKHGFRVLEAETGRDAVEQFRGGVDLALLDHRLPDGDGLQVLRALRNRDSDVPVIWMTPFSASEGAPEAMKEGAYHAITKPFKLDEMMLLVQKALETTRLKREVRALRAAQSQPYTFESIIGESPVMRELKAQMSRLPAVSGAPVLLVGESGAGKDLAARIIHYNSERMSRPLLQLNCAAHAESVVDSELFGFERTSDFARAGTKPGVVKQEGLFEQAEGGTVLLDEVGELPPALQAKLLRLIDERVTVRSGGTTDVKVDVRVIASTSRPLEQVVREGRFRGDLYQRLSAITLVVPSLRDRAGDVGILVQYYIDLFNREFKKRVHGAAPEALQLLEAHPWRGNIRELRNVVERAMLLSEREVLGPGDFDLRTQQSGSGPSQRVLMLPADGVNFEELERDLVIQALERTGGNQTRAATLLGMKRDQIRYRVEKFGLTRTGRRRMPSTVGAPQVNLPSSSSTTGAESAPAVRPTNGAARLY